MLYLLALLYFSPFILHYTLEINCWRMDLETSHHNHPESKPFAKLSAKPTAFYQN